MLLASQAEVDARNYKRETPLHKAAMNGCAGAAEVLLANHAGIDARDNAGNTPLHVASSDCGDYTECKKTEELLRQHGGHK